MPFQGPHWPCTYSLGSRFGSRNYVRIGARQQEIPIFLFDLQQPWSETDVSIQTTSSPWTRLAALPSTPAYVNRNLLSHRPQCGAPLTLAQHARDASAGFR